MLLTSLAKPRVWTPLRRQRLSCRFTWPLERTSPWTRQWLGLQRPGYVWSFNLD